MAILTICQATSLVAQNNVIYEYATLWLSRDYDKPSTAVLFTANGKKEYTCSIASSTDREDMLRYTSFVHVYINSERLTNYINQLALEGWVYYEAIGLDATHPGYVSYMFRRPKG